MLASKLGFLTSTTDNLTSPAASLETFFCNSLILAPSCPKTTPGRAVNTETVHTPFDLSISTCDNNASFNSFER